mmetsp:Transcript_14396/g.50056  ORF Transcript_14396/g.50056 Transcript_14396/m.50056 type:complete len:332 (-) Transcript_14396:84-1079(-)
MANNNNQDETPPMAAVKRNDEEDAGGAAAAAPAEPADVSLGFRLTEAARMRAIERDRRAAAGGGVLRRLGIEGKKKNLVGFCCLGWFCVIWFIIGVYWCVTESPGDAWPPWLEVQMCCSDVNPASGGCNSYYSALRCPSFIEMNGTLSYDPVPEAVPYRILADDYSTAQSYTPKIFCPDGITRCTITFHGVQGGTTIMPSTTITMSDDNSQDIDSDQQAQAYIQRVDPEICPADLVYASSFTMYENTESGDLVDGTVPDPTANINLIVTGVQVSDPANLMGLTAMGYPKKRPMIWLRPETVNGLFLAGILICVFAGMGFLMAFMFAFITGC